MGRDVQLGASGLLVTEAGTPLAPDAVAAAPVATVNAKTADYTLALTDAGGVVTVTKATAVSVTVPANATVAFPLGTVIEIIQLGAGAVTIVAADGVTVSSADGLVFSEQYEAARVVKVATNTWVAIGSGLTT